MKLKGGACQIAYQISLDEDDNLRVCTVKISSQCCDVLLDKRKLLRRFLATWECFNANYSDVAPVALEADECIITGRTSRCYLNC